MDRQDGRQDFLQMATRTMLKAARSLRQMNFEMWINRSVAIE